MERILKDILNELKTMNDRVGRLEKGQQALEQGQQALEKGQQALEQGQQALEQGQKDLAIEMRSGFDGVNKKLDTIYAQVAHNTEQEVKLNEVVSKVEALETDNKLIKKLVANQ